MRRRWVCEWSVEGLTLGLARAAQGVLVLPEMVSVRLVSAGVALKKPWVVGGVTLLTCVLQLLSGHSRLGA